MNRIHLICAAGMAALLSACSMPTSSVTSGSQRPTLAVTGAPPGSTLKVDGAVIGDASLYDGKQNVVKIEEGMHQVTVEQNGAVVHTETIYAASGENKSVEIGTTPQ